MRFPDGLPIDRIDGLPTAARQLPALPETLPAGEWDARRGGFRLAGNPEWERVRATYDHQLVRPRPIVTDPPPSPLAMRLRRLRVQLSWALDIFFGRRP